MAPSVAWRIGGLILAVCFQAGLSGDKAPTPSPAGMDGKTIQGNWTVTVYDNGIKEHQEWLKKIAAGATILINRDSVTREGADEITFTLNPSASPKEVDLKVWDITYRAIYQLKANKIILCVANKSKGKRPTRFEPLASGEWLYIELVRAP